MQRRNVSYAMLVTLWLVLICGPWIAYAQQEPPKTHKGFKTLKTQIVDLEPEIEGMQGRQLRLRLLTIEPGGHIGVHSHKDRPAVTYFIEGTDTVVRNLSSLLPLIFCAR
jgi:mannose-6-phosphate isomerase-like protein (cupin superfamily)